MAKSDIEITADAQQAEATFDRLNEKQKEQEAGFANIGDAGEQSSRQVAAANESAATKGTASYDRILRELRKQGPEGRAQAKAIEKHLQATGKAGRRSMEEVVDELGSFDDEAKIVANNAGEDFDRLSKKAKKSFGSDALNDLTKFAIGWVSVSKAIDVATRSIEAMKAAKAAAVTSLESTATGDSRLLQISADSAEFNDRRDMADKFASQYGITRDESRDLVFNADSSNFLDTAETIAKNSQVLSIEAQSTVAGQIPKLFTNDAITGEQAIDSTLAAAAESRLTFEDIARALPAAAASAAPAGAGADETLALLSVLSDRFKSGETTADRIAAFGAAVNLDAGSETMTDEKFAEKTKAEDDRVEREQKRLRSLEERRNDAQTSLERAKADPKAKPETIADREKQLERAQRSVDEFDRADLEKKTIDRGTTRESFKGGGLIAAAEKLKALPEDQRAEFLGESKELNEAYNAIADLLDTIKERETTIAAARAASGTEAAPTAKKRAIAELDDRSVARRNKLSADNAAEIATEKALASDEANRIAERNRQKADGYDAGESAFAVETKAAFRTTEDTTGDVLKAAVGYNVLDQTAVELNIGSQFDKEENRPKLSALATGAKALSNKTKAAKPGDQVLLGKSDIQAMVLEASGDFILPDQITPEYQAQVTREIKSFATQVNNRSLFSSTSSDQAEREAFVERVNLNPTDSRTSRAAAIANETRGPTAVSNFARIEAPSGTLEQAAALANETGEQIQASNSTRVDVSSATLEQAAAIANETSESVQTSNNSRERLTTNNAGNVVSSDAGDSVQNKLLAIANEIPQEVLGLSEHEIRYGMQSTAERNKETTVERLPSELATPIDSATSTTRSTATDPPLSERTGRDLLDVQNEVLRIAREQLEVDRQVAAAAGETATNTKPKPQRRDEGALIQAATNQADTRATR